MGTFGAPDRRAARLGPAGAGNLSSTNRLASTYIRVQCHDAEFVKDSARIILPDQIGAATHSSQPKVGVHTATWGYGLARVSPG